MEIVKVLFEGKEYWGVLAQQGVLLAGPDIRTFNDAYLQFRSIGEISADSNLVSLDKVNFLAPLDVGSRVFCVGLNYKDHANEAGRDLPEYPSIFLRSPYSFVGHKQKIIKPNCSEKFDYEGELAVIIGTEGRHIQVEKALQHVAGYSCMAENSVRDFQKHSTQVTPGKNFDNSGAMGPAIKIVDAIYDISVITKLNGVEVQSGKIADLIFPVPELIAYISTFTTLRPGDVIATGTPAGVGSKRKPPLYMQVGDSLSVTVTGVGELLNLVGIES